MPDDVAPPDNDGGGGGLMSGSRGWIIVILVVVIEAAFFVGLLVTKSDKKPADTELGSGMDMYTAEDFMQKEHTMDKLNYSIPMPSGQPMTLAMKLVLVMQPTPQEIREKVSITPEDWMKFEMIIKKLDPWIRDQLTRFINKMSSSDLSTDRGQQRIREFVKEKVNDKLATIKLDLSDKNISHRRVQEVLITNYYFN